MDSRVHAASSRYAHSSYLRALLILQIARIQNIIRIQKRVLETDDTEQRKRQRLLDGTDDVSLPLLPLPDLSPFEDLVAG
jgi:hypothetical protein